MSEWTHMSNQELEEAIVGRGVSRLEAKALAHLRDDRCVRNEISRLLRDTTPSSPAMLARRPPKQGSQLEESLWFQLKVRRHAQQLPAMPEREWRFDKTRAWRFDFAFVDLRLAVEIEGGTWAGGAHVRAKRYAQDLDKYNAAAIQGWVVLRFDNHMVEDGTAADLIVKAITELSPWRDPHQRRPFE